MIFNLTQPVMDSAPKFTYTGTYEYIDDGGGNWRIKFLSSGVFKPLKDMTIDVFLVGGGAGGSNGFGGGGGGYTKTVKKTKLSSGTEYNIEIGAGGGVNGAGGTTSAFGNSASGGSPGDNFGHGGNGGSGGGSEKQAGASDGNSAGGTGQGTTTREFEEIDGDLYSGGGGGGNAGDGTNPGAGGDGGGGAGGHASGYYPFIISHAIAGTPNTGGGGGGRGYASGKYANAAAGGSGIVIIRKHK